VIAIAISNLHYVTSLRVYVSEAGLEEMLAERVDSLLATGLDASQL